MKITTLSFFCLLSAACLAQSETSQDKVELYWSETINNSDFNKTLAVIREGPKEVWPAVFSAKYSASLPASNRVQQAVLMKLADRVAHDIELYEKDLQEQDAGAFTKSVHDLLSLRRVLGQSPSYVNLILVDTIDRVIFVNLAERLASSESTSPELIALVESLQENRPDMRQFKLLAEMETRRKLTDDVKYEAASDVERLELLWTALEPDTTPAFPRNILQAGTYQLFKNQDIPLLLNRVMMSDYYIHSALPDLAAYRQNTKTFSPRDTYQQIKAVLGEDTKTPESLGSQYWGERRAAGVVSELLEKVQSGKVRSQLYFSLPAIQAPR